MRNVSLNFFSPVLLLTKHHGAQNHTQRTNGRDLKAATVPTARPALGRMVIPVPVAAAAAAPPPTEVGLRLESAPTTPMGSTYLMGVRVRGLDRGRSNNEGLVVVRSVRVAMDETVEERRTPPPSVPRAVKGDECRIKRSKGVALEVLPVVRVVGSSHSTYTYSSSGFMLMVVVVVQESFVAVVVVVVWGCLVCIQQRRIQNKRHSINCQRPWRERTTHTRRSF